MVMKHYYFILIAFVLLLLISAHTTLRAVNHNNSQNQFEKYIQDHNLGTLEKGIWWYNPPENSDDKDFLANLFYGLKLYMDYPNQTQGDFDKLNYAFWSLKREDLQEYIDAKNKKERLRILQEYPITTFPQFNVPFNKYLEQLDLGRIENGIWTISNEFSENAPQTNLSYVLKLYENYATAHSINPGSEIKELHYVSWSLNQDDLQRYFESSNTYYQSQILGEVLSR